MEDEGLTITYGDGSTKDITLEVTGIDTAIRDEYIEHGGCALRCCAIWQKAPVAQSESASYRIGKGACGALFPLVVGPSMPVRLRA